MTDTYATLSDSTKVKIDKLFSKGKSTKEIYEELKLTRGQVYMYLYDKKRPRKGGKRGKKGKSDSKKMSDVNKSDIAVGHYEEGSDIDIGKKEEIANEEIAEWVDRVDKKFPKGKSKQDVGGIPSLLKLEESKGKKSDVFTFDGKKYPELSKAYRSKDYEKCAREILNVLNAANAADETIEFITGFMDALSNWGGKDMDKVSKFTNDEKFIDDAGLVKDIVDSIKAGKYDKALDLINLPVRDDFPDEEIGKELTDEEASKFMAFADAETRDERPISELIGDEDERVSSRIPSPPMPGGYDKPTEEKEFIPPGPGPFTPRPSFNPGQQATSSDWLKDVDRMAEKMPFNPPLAKSESKSESSQFHDGLLMDIDKNEIKTDAKFSYLVRCDRCGQPVVMGRIIDATVAVCDKCDKKPKEKIEQPRIGFKRYGTRYGAPSATDKYAPAVVLGALGLIAYLLHRK